MWDFSNGYVVYGGLIGGVLANFIYFKRKNLSFLEYADLVIPQVALGQAFGKDACLQDVVTEKRLIYPLDLCITLLNLRLQVYH